MVPKEGPVSSEAAPESVRMDGDGSLKFSSVAPLTVGTPPMVAVKESCALAIPGALKDRILAIEIDRYFFRVCPVVESPRLTRDNSVRFSDLLVFIGSICLFLLF